MMCSYDIDYNIKNMKWESTGKKIHQRAMSEDVSSQIFNSESKFNYYQSIKSSSNADII
jgi:hypothetical protein